MLLPPDLRDWVPERHMVHFILEAIESLDLSCFLLNWRGSGSEQYPPSTLLALLVYCYATGRFGSRRIDEASYSDVVVRYICGNHHPDHDTICSFRRKKAEQADATPLDDGLSIPEEIARREERIVRLEKAKVVIEERFEQVRKQKQAEYEAKLKAREASERVGKRPGGRNPKPPADKPQDNAQYNFTDPDSRIMKAGQSQAFEQSYNAQAAVDAEGSYLILGQRVTNHSNDKEELKPTLQLLIRRCATPTRCWPTAASSPRQSAGLTEQMRWRLRTRKGKERYRLRKQTVEPVFGIIKQAMGFRQFHLRGSPKVALEWNLVTLAYNMRRMFALVGEKSQPQPGWSHSYGF